VGKNGHMARLDLETAIVARSKMPIKTINGRTVNNGADPSG
jgi:hypothetical protein